MTVKCDRCGREWPRDPALEVPCPTCKARIGQWCRRPSGHRAGSLHSSRDIAAMDAGLLVRCDGVDVDPETGEAQRRLFSVPAPPTTEHTPKG